MSINQDILQLSKRIAVSHDWAAAKAFKAYVMHGDERAIISRAAVEILALLPSSSGTGSALLSASLAVSLGRKMSAPIHVVTGSLNIENQPVLNNHSWLMVGPYIVDIGLFRLAYSSNAPAALVKHIDLVFGPNKALYADHMSMSKRVGLRYRAETVLNEDEINALMSEAFRLIKAARAASDKPSAD